MFLFLEGWGANGAFPSTLTGQERCPRACGRGSAEVAGTHTTPSRTRKCGSTGRCGRPSWKADSEPPSCGECSLRRRVGGPHTTGPRPSPSPVKAAQEDQPPTSNKPLPQEPPGHVGVACRRVPAGAAGTGGGQAQRSTGDSPGDASSCAAMLAALGRASPPSTRSSGPEFLLTSHSHRHTRHTKHQVPWCAHTVVSAPLS